jgi:hypothetical protein
MSRFARVTAIGLSLAILLAVSAVGWRVATYSPPASGVGIANPAAGHAFYAALNQAIAGDGAAQLDAIVTDDYADHGGSSERSLATVVEELNALGSSFPGTRFVVRDIQVSGTSLIVSLEPLSPAPVSFASMKLTVAPFDGHFELLQVRDGKISARWAAPLTLPSIETFAVRALQLSAAGATEIRLDRLTLPEGAGFEPAPNAAMLVIVESGTVRQRMRVPMRTSVIRLEGQVFPLASATTDSLEPDRAEGATLLILSRSTIRATDPPAPSLHGGATNDLLWLEHLEIGPGTWELSAGLLETPPGIELTLVTESARLLVVSSTGEFQINSRFDDMQSLDHRYAIANVGRTAFAQDEGAIAISGAATLTLWAVPGATGAAWVISIAS